MNLNLVPAEHKSRVLESKYIQFILLLSGG